MDFFRRESLHAYTLVEILNILNPGNPYRYHPGDIMRTLEHLVAEKLLEKKRINSQEHYIWTLVS